MFRFSAFVLVLAVVLFAGFLMLKSVDLSPVPEVNIPVILTPTTVTVNGPVILDAIHNQAKLETVSMTFAMDQDLTKIWGVEGLCQETVTYLGYFNVTAGIDLQKIGAGDVKIENGATLAQTAITIKLPPASVTHVELDTQRSRVVHNQISIISQICGSHLADMVVEVQSNLQKRAEASALDKDIIKMAQERAGFEIQKLLLTMGFSRVTIQ